MTDENKTSLLQDIYEAKLEGDKVCQQNERDFNSTIRRKISQHENALVHFMDLFHETMGAMKVLGIKGDKTETMWRWADRVADSFDDLKCTFDNLHMQNVQAAIRESEKMFVTAISSALEGKPLK